jgi:RNA polymerase sigma-70 factor, ECF subfamily
MEQIQPEASRPAEHAAGAQALSDRELVTEVLRKDRKATAEFVARCADSVYGYVRRRLIPRGDLVEDVVQEVFLAAWESLETFRGESSLRTWVLGIARHKVEDHYRKRLRELAVEEHDEASCDEPASSEDLEQAVATHQAGQRTREILAELPEVYCVILLWRYWEKRSLREIAAQTERTEKAVERLLARARQQFKKRWNERESSARR